ncbi:MAG TPA: hypothetical protein VEA79_11230, partial [Phenylobacterium sp.]|nr:hypothetical protein [Phenylobacterium sp.]
MNWVRLAGLGAGVLAVIGAVLAVRGGTAHYQRISADSATLAACRAAAQGGLRTRDSLTACPQPLARLAAAGAAAEACDRALTG